MHPSVLERNGYIPGMSTAPGTWAVGAADGTTGARLGCVAFVISRSSFACSGDGGSSVGSTSAVSSEAGSELSRGLLLGPSGVGLLVQNRGKIHQQATPGNERGALKQERSKTHLRGRLTPEKDHLWSARSPKTPDQDGDPTSSTAPASGGRRDSDTCSESGDAGT